MKKTIEDKINSLSLSGKDKDELRILLKMYELDILAEYDNIKNCEEMSWKLYLRIKELEKELNKS